MDKDETELLDFVIKSVTSEILQNESVIDIERWSSVVMMLDSISEIIKPEYQEYFINKYKQ